MKNLSRTSNLERRESEPLFAISIACGICAALFVVILSLDLVPGETHYQVWGNASRRYKGVWMLTWLIALGILLGRNQRIRNSTWRDVIDWLEKLNWCFPVFLWALVVSLLNISAGKTLILMGLRASVTNPPLAMLVVPFLALLGMLPALLLIAWDNRRRRYVQNHSVGILFAAIAIGLDCLIIAIFAK